MIFNRETLGRLGPEIQFFCIHNVNAIYIIIKINIEKNNKLKIKNKIFLQA